MGVSIYIADKDRNPIDDSRLPGPHWTYSNWGMFSSGIDRALKQSYVWATEARNEAREYWEQDCKKGYDDDGYALSEFERLSHEVKRIASLKDFWAGSDVWAGSDDGASCVWRFNSKAKVIDCLTEALIVDAYDEFDDDYVCLKRLAHCLRYLTAHEGDIVYVAFNPHSSERV